MLDSMVRAVFLCLVAVGIASLSAGTAVAEGLADQVHPVRMFGFEEADDRNFDMFPDGWSRRTGPAFPRYIRVEIDRDRGRSGHQSLHFALNGGQAALYSPALRVEAGRLYRLDGYVLSSGLTHDAAVLTVSVLDTQRRRIERHVSPPVRGTGNDWTRAVVGPIVLPPAARFLVVGCHIVGADRHDVRGDVWFDDLTLGVMPQLSLTTAANRHYFRPGEAIDTAVSVRGEVGQEPGRLSLKVTDESGAVHDEATLPVAGGAKDPHAETVLRRSLPALPIGFYRIEAAFERDDTVLLRARTSFVMLECPPDSKVASEFGWSFSAGTKGLSYPALQEMLIEGGVGWLKLPLWSAASAPADSDLEQFLNDIQKQSIVPVGMLSDPPPALAEKFAHRLVSAQAMLSHPREVWGPALDPVVARYAYPIRHWQLGDETDESFAGTDLGPAVGGVQREFDRIGHDTQLGVRWNWDAAPPAGSTCLSFVSLPSPPGQSPKQLLEHLQRSALTERRWLLLEPLARSNAAVEKRTIDLTRRILAAKTGGADVVFAANPLDAESGLIHADGSPTELFLPWRTFALTLRGTKPLGSLALTHGSHNALFSRGSEMVMAVWNDVPTEERMYLSTEARVLDTAGRETVLPVDSKTGEQLFTAGPVPQLIVGVSEAIARWRLALRFERGRVPSEYGLHEDALLVTNTFPQGVNGRVTLRLPRGWEAEPNQWTIQAAAGETVRLPMQLKFPFDATLGTFQPEIDFEINADRVARFTQRLTYQLGIDDVSLDVVLRRTKEGRLEIEQQITNKTEPFEELTFTCLLFVPGQIRQKQTATKVGRAVDVRTWFIANPDALADKTLWLKVEQIDGRRFLNRHIRLSEARIETEK